LQDDQNYLYYVQCQDEAGNLNSTDYLINFSVGSYSDGGGATPYCGDNNCDANESCSSCETDCGVCQPPPTGSGLEIVNTNYLTYNGQPVALFGMGNFWLFADPGLDWQDMIDSYANDGSNFMRVTTIGTPVRYTGLDPVDILYPWERTGPGTDNVGGLKFDLDRFNETFFSRMQTITDYAANQDVILLVLLWDEIPIESRPSRWPRHPFNPNNNINNLGLPNDMGSDGDSRLDNFYDLSNTELKNYQDAFVNKVLDTIGNRPNVILGISNEYTGPQDWHQHQQDLVDSWEQNNAEVVLTNEMRWGGFDPDYTNIISRSAGAQGSSGNWRVDRPVVNYRMSPKWHDELDLARKEAWNILVDLPTQHNDAASLAARAQINDLRNFVNTLPINEMKPSNTFNPDPVSGGDARIKEYDTYVVYLINGGSTTIDLTGTANQFQADWYNPRIGTYTSGGTVSGGGSRSFTSPITDDSVLLVKVN
jgi:hypothetical protein